MPDPIVGTVSIVIERKLDDGKEEAPDEDVLLAARDLDVFIPLCLVRAIVFFQSDLSND